MSILFLEVQQSHNHLIEVVRSPFFLINMMLLRYYTTCHTALYYLSGLLLSRTVKYHMKHIKILPAQMSQRMTGLKCSKL